MFIQSGIRVHPADRIPKPALHALNILADAAVLVLGVVMLVGMVDTVMVSDAGEAAVSGVALVDMVNYLIITVMAALTTGGAVLISQYLGSEQPEQAAFSAGQLVRISGLFSLVIAAVCLVFRQSILRLFFGAVEPDVMETALTLNRSSKSRQ